MLQYQTIEDSTLVILKDLMEIPDLEDFRLVGGTSLALQYGHRNSIDIDLFGDKSFEEIDLARVLSQFDKVQNLLSTKYIKTYLINGIKVDMVNYSYPWIGKLLNEDDIRMASVEDIAAMKINAITNRGSKKDFYDLDLILNHYSLKDILQFYQKKYYDGTVFMALKSLTYFVDAEAEDDPELLAGQDWESVKAKVKNAYIDYLNN
ncbi:nucleotidyl transferase AbiEii/AbiGii toxin family protein [Marivirga sp.]|uniref:nucleotidyl transferase AbiEii/AbiGii toxin family protein n=1 Tax=Marivirga sp. TaxID=2018662 RepID=UPI003DA72348